ncbi:MAG: hypothetical protein ABI263_04420 [Gelidibacter sp.]
MKKWHALLPNSAIILMLVLIVLLNLISSYFEVAVLTKAMTLVIIPILILIYFYRQRIMANIFFTIFVLYFLGILFNVLDQFSLSSKLSESCFLGAYALLVFLMIGKLKHVKFEGLVSWYLIVILLVNTYFLYMMFTVVQDGFKDSVILTLLVSRGVALLIIGFLAFAIYLSKETSQSILFLTIVCCFIFSDVLSFITSMYIHFWLFEGIQNILQGGGLLLFCFYVYNHQEIANTSDKKTTKSFSLSKNVPVES